jgi:hypothetical protein
MSQTSDALVESSPSLTDYEFLDCGDLKRLERFGGRHHCLYQIFLRFHNIHGQQLSVSLR